MFKSIKAKILYKYDFFIYHLAFTSLRRIAETDIGFIYLVELWLRRYRHEKGIDAETKLATESFFETLFKIYNNDYGNEI